MKGLNHIDFAIAVFVMFTVVSFSMAYVSNYFSRQHAPTDSMRNVADYLKHVFFDSKGIPSDWETIGVLPVRIGLQDTAGRIPVILKDESGVNKTNEEIDIHFVFDKDCKYMVYNNSLRLYDNFFNETNFTIYNATYCSGNYLKEANIEFLLNLTGNESVTYYLYYSNKTEPWKNYSLKLYEDSLVGYWKFDENAGNIAHDSTVYGNDGTFYGTITTLTNSSLLYLTGTSPINKSHKITLPYYNQLYQANLTVTYINNTPSLAYNTVRVYINGVYAGSFEDNGESSAASYTIQNIENYLTVNGTNIITYEGNVSNITQSLIKYNHSVTWVPGYRKNALSFDGINDYVDAGNDDSLNITNAITIAVWIKADSWSSYKDVIIDKSYHEKNGYELYQHGEIGRIYFRLWEGYSVAAQAAFSTSQIPVAEWHHLSGVWNGTHISIYLDGNQKDIKTGTSPSRTLGDLTIGGWGDRLYKGLIDNVRIYNRSLTADEIKALYNFTKPMYVKSPDVNVISDDKIKALQNLSYTEVRSSLGLKRHFNVTLCGESFGKHVPDKANVIVSRKPVILRNSTGDFGACIAEIRVW